MWNLESPTTRLVCALLGSLALHVGLWFGLSADKGGPRGEGGRGETLAVHLVAASPTVASTSGATAAVDRMTLSAAKAPVFSPPQGRSTRPAADSAGTPEEVVVTQRLPEADLHWDLLPTRNENAVAHGFAAPASGESADLASEEHAEPGSTVREMAGGPYYFASHEVDKATMPQGAIYPQTPPGTEDHSGYLVLRLLISELGAVDRVEVLISEPAGMFDAAAAESFGTASFYPAIRDGFPVKSQMVVELKIEPDFGALLSQSANMRPLLDRGREQ